MAAPKDDRSLGELFAELSRDMGTLVRKEVELAKTEMTAKVKTVGTQSATIAAGGALVHAGFLVFLAAVVMALTQLGVQPWLAALVIAIVTIIVGYVLVNRGLVNLRRTNITPTQTIEVLKETTTWTNKTPA